MLLMFVCICNRLNDGAVDGAIASGASTPDGVQDWHGCRFNCGRCRDQMSAMIRAHPRRGGLALAEHSS